MPYITTEKRKLTQAHGPRSAGELNFKITYELVEYLKHNNTYQGINDVLGALEGAKLEMYRRWAAPYEDFKISQNGDVYPTGG